MTLRRTVTPIVAALSTFLLAGLAPAAAPNGVSLTGVRIGAKDGAALARFYQAAFGMHEVQRIQTPQFLEIMLDFGATAAAAKANGGADVVIMQRAADDGHDTMAHVVKTLQDNLQSDPFYPNYGTPPVLAQLIAKGALGQKAGAGF